MYLILVKCFHNIVNIETKLFGVSKMSTSLKKNSSWRMLFEYKFCSMSVIFLKINLYG